MEWDKPTLEDVRVLLQDLKKGEEIRNRRRENVIMISSFLKSDKVVKSWKKEKTPSKDQLKCRISKLKEARLRITRYDEKHLK